jgi:hypothetical protein
LQRWKIGFQPAAKDEQAFVREAFMARDDSEYLLMKYFTELIEYLTQ